MRALTDKATWKKDAPAKPCHPGAKTSDVAATDKVDDIVNVNVAVASARRQLDGSGLV